MKGNNFFLFIIPTAIWGSTWFIIKFQLSQTDPLLSVSYRFGIAGLILLVYCLVFKLELKFSRQSHLLMALQGFFLFGFNYLFVYMAEKSLTSGLVAAAFSILIFLNIFFAAIILKNKVKILTIIGAVLGVTGIVLIFREEFVNLDFSGDNFTGLLYCLLGIMLASLGNITSAYNQRKNLPIIQTNMYGMIYGALALLGIAIISGSSFIFDTSLPYVLSLLYLAIFGSVIAFGAYLKLIGNIGPDKAAYVILTAPIIALFISSYFEGFKWTPYSISGTLLIVTGSLLSLKKT
ncbi:EamA family transporter [Fulvivirgaceae bacterium BMA12]|uniref:EamA family transporter n=1 Tax=Agaribacillus aureus TaxID=3051825 RepID=A0ABT8LEJ9_9BACT|nr:EamA family transporter [Fulvivirgaceae bacterium BMA12]